MPCEFAAREHRISAILRCSHEGGDRRSGAMFGATMGMVAASAAVCGSVCIAASAAGLRACFCCCTTHVGVWTFSMVAPGSFESSMRRGSIFSSTAANHPYGRCGVVA